MPEPYIVHARNPVEALHWWSVLSTVLGKYDATLVAAKITTANMAARKRSKNKDNQTPPVSTFSPSHGRDRRDILLSGAILAEASRTLTPRRAEESRVSLQEKLQETSWPVNRNQVWSSCGGIYSRLRKAEWITVKGSFGYLPSRTVVIVAPDPLEEKMDRERNFHCNDGPAITWDDFSLWFLHGVRVTEDQLEGNMSFQQFLNISNSEVRRVLMERKGWTWITDHLKPLDVCPDPANAGNMMTLYELPPRLSSWDRRRLVIMTNASPSRDGSKRVYGEFVPRDCNTAMQAQAWAWGVSTSVYANLVCAT